VQNVMVVVLRCGTPTETTRFLSFYVELSHVSLGMSCHLERVCEGGSAARLRSRHATRRVCDADLRASLSPSSQKERLRLTLGKRPKRSYPGSTAARGAAWPAGASWPTC
jgi:hypothetical protein